VSVSVVVADDHPIVLRGIEALLRAEPEFSIVSRCVNGEEALAATRQHRPDLLLADLNMPRRDGLAILRELAGSDVPTRVVLLAAEITGDQALEALRLGARGVLTKDLAPESLVSCLRVVHGGDRYVEDRLLRHCVDGLLAGEGAARAAVGLLTPREAEVTRMVAAGLRNREIGSRLQVAESTVKLHLHNIYQKLAITNRVELTLWAQQQGLVAG
jgi:DNA-binding NarL/FixJ family response regulator